MNFLSWIIFVPLQILFIPITILGVLLVGYRQIAVSKRLGLSLTAIEVINARWTMHVFGMRDDEPTARLAAALPNTSLIGLWLCLFPLWLKAKISGRIALYPRKPDPGSETLADLIVVRTLYFDRLIERLSGTVEQVVIMGAGYDTRAYGGLRGRSLGLFELDQSNVQDHKRETLKKAGIDTGHMNFVSVDFETESFMQRLVESGFDVSKKTLFLWEGVTLYLSETDVRMTLRDIRDTVTAGSVILADVYAERLIDYGGKGWRKSTLDLTGENVKFGLNFTMNHDEVLSKFVQSESMDVGECYFMGTKNDRGPFMVVVEMKID